MMMIVFAFMILLFCWYIFAPFVDRTFHGKKCNFAYAQIEDLNLRKQEILSSIDDLEYDLRMRKIAPADYHQIKDKLLAEGASMVEALKKAKHHDSNSHPNRKQKRLKKAVA